MPQLVTLTMAPAIDVSTSVDRIVPAEKLRCGPAQRDAGGGGINVARVVARFGARATAIFPAGGQGGALLRELVAADSVESRIIEVAGETRHNFAVTERARLAQYRFVLPADRLRARDWRACLAQLATAGPGSDFVCASGGLPPGVPQDFYARVARLVAGWGGRFALDSSGGALTAALAAPITLIKPNLAELSEIAGRPLATEADRVQACRDLTALGNVAMVALSLGAQGALLVTARDAWRAAALPVRPLSTVGAGDSFLGGMLAGLVSGLGAEDALRQATAAGAAALLAPGTGLAHPRDVRRLAPRVGLERL